MRRIIVSLLLVIGCMTVAAPATPVPPVSAADGLCRLLTVKEVRTALGKGKWQIARDGDVADECYMHNGLMDRKSRAFSLALRASNEENQAEFRDSLVSSGATELTIAGFPAVQYRNAVTVFFPDPWDMLQLSPVGYEDQDVAKATQQLAELAAARLAAEAGPSPAATAPAPSVAGDGSADPCALLTAEEISAAIEGEPMTVSPERMSGHCTYLDDAGTFFEVVVEIAPTPDTSLIELRRALMSDLTDLEVAGFPALSVTSAGGRSQTVMVYPTEAVELTFSLQTTTGADAMSALTALAELGTARALQAGISAPPTAAPPTSAPSAGTGLCAILSIDELAKALRDDSVAVALDEPDGCVWSTASAPVSVSLEIKVGDDASILHQNLGMMPSTFQIAGMTAAQTKMPSAKGMSGTGVVLLPDDATAVLLTVVTPRKRAGVAGAGRAIAELVAPRLEAYLDG